MLDAGQEDEDDMFRLKVAALVMLAAPLLAAPGWADEGPKVLVTKTATCGCCSAWVAHLKAAGYQVSAKNVSYGILSKFKTKQGIKPNLASCHTATISGYTIEGHVPAREIRRLLEEKPDAIGLTVPGMPVGSPGMEVGNSRDAYDVLLIRRDGTTEVFAHYPAKG